MGTNPALARSFALLAQRRLPHTRCRSAVQVLSPKGRLRASFIRSLEGLPCPSAWDAVSDTDLDVHRAPSSREVWNQEAYSRGAWPRPSLRIIRMLRLQPSSSVVHDDRAFAPCIVPCNAMWARC